MSVAPCLRVPKFLGERAITLAGRLNLFDRELKVQRVDEYLCIPLIREPLPAEIEELKKSLQMFEVTSHGFPERAGRPRELVDALENMLPPHLLASLPRAMDFVGDIAVVEIPPELEGCKGVLGEAILTMHKRLRTVLAKASAVGGVYRVREFEVIAGEAKTETVHREHGCAYHVDLTRAYFSPRLSHEHERVASQVREGETVIDMFAGVGPFSIMIAKKCGNVRVYAIDVNPDALHFLRRNITANRVEGKVTPILGEARRIVEERLLGTADRVIMNLPERAIEYVDAACGAIKPVGGVIHYYGFASSPEPLEAVKNRFIEAVRRTNRSVSKVLLAKTVRATAPLTWQVVTDAEVQ